MRNKWSQKVVTVLIVEITPMNRSHMHTDSPFFVFIALDYVIFIIQACWKSHWGGAVAKRFNTAFWHRVTWILQDTFLLCLKAVIWISYKALKWLHLTVLVSLSVRLSPSFHTQWKGEHWIHMKLLSSKESCFYKHFPSVMMDIRRWCH